MTHGRQELTRTRELCLSCIPVTYKHQENVNNSLISCTFTGKLVLFLDVLQWTSIKTIYLEEHYKFVLLFSDSRAFYCWRLAVLAQEKNILLTLIHWSWLLYFLYACCWNAHVYRSTIRYKTSFWVQCASNACKIQIVFILLHVINPVSHSLTVKKFLACLSRKQ